MTTPVYERDGVRFLYPENWTVDDQSQAQGLLCAVSLEAPSGAIWTLNIEQGHRDCEQLAGEVRRAMSEEYEDLESEPWQGAVAGTQAVGYEMHFYCMDMVVKALVQCFHWDDRTVMLMTQAEARDHDELAPVFAAIATSLLSA